MDSTKVGTDIIHDGLALVECEDGQEEGCRSFCGVDELISEDECIYRFGKDSCKIDVAEDGTLANHSNEKHNRKDRYDGNLGQQ